MSTEEAKAKAKAIAERLSAGKSAAGGAAAAAAVVERLSAGIAANEEQVKKKFKEVIQQLIIDPRFSYKNQSEYDYFIGLPEHSSNIGSHHIHFYIKNHKLAWHHTNHDKNTRDPPAPGYKEFKSLQEMFDLLTENAKGIPTIMDRFQNARVHDPFASSIKQDKSKKGQRQKRSYRKRSYRKRSYRKRSYRKRS